MLTPQDGGNFVELASFQGASFFRALARGQNLGAMARALSIKMADPRGEEFPAFRAVWIERPTLAANALVIHALIDSESVTGAFRFTIRPVEATIIDSECTLFARVAVDNFGLATMSATHLSGTIDNRRGDDLRPNVSEVSGLQMLTGKGEWLWRPVSNRDTLQISTFVDENPRGFGFLQRDRDFDHYQDDVQHWEARPSVWVEPIGDWSSGGVQLIEIPSDSEVNDNIIAYWKPQQSLAVGSETSFAYRQFWCWTPPERPALAVATQSREGRGSSPKRRRFIVEFVGDMLALPQNAEILTPNLNASPGAIASIRTFASADNTSRRVLFEIDFGGEIHFGTAPRARGRRQPDQRDLDVSMDALSNPQLNEQVVTQLRPLDPAANALRPLRRHAPRGAPCDADAEPRPLLRRRRTQEPRAPARSWKLARPAVRFRRRLRADGLRRA